MALSRRNEAEEVEPTVVSEDTQEQDVLEPEEGQEESPDTTVDLSTMPVTSASTPPMRSPGGDVSAKQKLADMGFDGLDLDWTSFPTIVLDKTEFATSDGHSLDTSEITVRLQGSRKRYVYKTKTASDDDEPELAYTYDLSEQEDEESDLYKKIEAWRQEGLGWVVKEYVEAFAVVEDANSPLDGQMVMLQIPPTSKGRFAGYVQSNLLGKKRSPSEYLTRCCRGEKITKAKQPFYPWKFEYLGN